MKKTILFLFFILVLSNFTLADWVRPNTGNSSITNNITNNITIYNNSNLGWNVSGNNVFLLNGSNNIGIGKSSPTVQLDINKSGFQRNLGTVTTGIALNLENDALANSVNKSQDSARIRLAGQYWDGSTSRPMVLSMGLEDNGQGTNSHLRIYIKRGTGAVVELLNIDAGGKFGSALQFNSFDNRESLLLGRRLGNDATANTTYDQYTPYDLFDSIGWKNSTNTSQRMSLAVYNAPEQGVISPKGVHKYVFGTNTVNPVIVNNSNEIMRMTWGNNYGDLGVSFNELDLANYTAKFRGIVNINGTLNVTNNVTITVPYGEIFNKTTVDRTFTIANYGVYYNLTGFNQAKYLNGFINGSNRLTAQIGGLYEVSFSMSINCGLTGSYGVAIVQNFENPETSTDDCYNHFDGTASHNIRTINCFKRLNVGDNLSVVLEDNDNPAQDCILQSIRLGAKRVGE